MFNIFAEYEQNRENSPLSIDDEKDVTENLINTSNAFQDPKYNDNPDKPVIWLRIFMKAHIVNYVKESYLEGEQFMQDELAEVSLKHRLWLLKLQRASQLQIQQSLALDRKFWKKVHRILNAIRFHNIPMKLPLPQKFAMHLQSKLKAMITQSS